MNELTNIDKRLSVYFSAVALLNVARRVRTQGLDNFMDILSTILKHDFCQNCGDLSLQVTGMTTSKLVELLQKSAVEHLTTYRQLLVRHFGSIVKIVKTDFEALYAYKCGDYQRCFRLSTQNALTLLYAAIVPNVTTSPDFCSITG